ncbi:MAG TPA: cytochrome b N-terminal domain-containing protein [Rhodanobacteraceae bacterium]|jgi:ubiquinol-cytochrome c reductase cytochrome b subunit|nr:cytochrome b N-terminal domain-containing protein [Rhodanobacteraceae bacterium]
MNAFTQWFADRAPGLDVAYKKHMTEYYAPKNFNVMYYFGSLALLVLVNQIVTGIFLTMFYTPTAAGAFDSVQYIMRDVQWGWLVRYMHVTGASMFFIVIYLHMFRGLMYGSYKKPRELVWLLGMLIFLALMAEAFMGYVLPWGNMSFWGAKVIITLFSAVPVIGEQLVHWIMGTLSVPGDPTLNRFFALHVVALPLVLLLLVVLHLGALHEVGSNNPDGVDVKHGPKGNRWNPNAPVDGIPFHPYYTLKDLVGVGVFLVVCAIIIFFEPTVGGFFIEHDNSIPANDLVTPATIKPVWYFSPFYAILRMIPSKGFGVLAMLASIVVLFLVPWLDRGKVKSVRYRGLAYKIALTLFTIVFLLLCAIGADLTQGWIMGLFGASSATAVSAELVFGRTLVVLYFAFFIFLWAYTFFGWEKTKPVPERVTTHA